MQQKAILVLGAGRSGTSTLVRALKALGVYLGRDFKRPTRKNPRGFYEEIHLLRLSKRVRRAAGLRPESVHLPPEEVWQTARMAELKSRMREAIVRHMGDAPVWGFKYASTGKLLPFWMALLPEMNIRPAFVFAYRNPLSVARSRARLDRFRGRQQKSDLEWLVNVVPWLHLTRGCPLVVVDYDRLVNEPEAQLRRMAARLGLDGAGPQQAGLDQGIESFCREFLNRDLRHTRFSDDDLRANESLHPMVREAALWLSAAAADRIDLDQGLFWYRWARLRERLYEMRSLLGLVDALQDDVRRARWWDVVTPIRQGWKAMPLLRKAR
ncbi:MAG: hypothetical protein Kow0020_10770 [Wenzhouxiangellaceae bacterium]